MSTISAARSARGGGFDEDDCSTESGCEVGVVRDKEEGNEIRRRGREKKEFDKTPYGQRFRNASVKVEDWSGMRAHESRQRKGKRLEFGT